MPSPKQCFVSYSHLDAALLTQMLPQVQALANLYGFTVWHDRKIAGGFAWSPAIEAAMDGSDLFLCLVTNRFFSSDYIFQHELPTARRASEQRGALVVPAVFEGTLWQSYFGSYIQAVPSDHGTGTLRAINRWRPREEGYSAAIKGLEKAICDHFGCGVANDYGNAGGKVAP
jgi:hypothetical protein